MAERNRSKQPTLQDRLSAWVEKTREQATIWNLAPLVMLC
jgi:hypothetical protein